MVANAAVAWRSYTQPIVATSSTEAEFLCAVHTAKMVKFIRAVMKELGYLREHASPLLVDNQAAIAIVNERKPTERSRHIDVQYIAIQEWRENGEVEMCHLPGVINPADALTKPVNSTLQHRHGPRLMGHYKPDYAVGYASVGDSDETKEGDSIEARESVEAQCATDGDGATDEGSATTPATATNAKAPPSQSGKYVTKIKRG